MPYDTRQRQVPRPQPAPLATTVTTVTTLPAAAVLLDKDHLPQFPPDHVLLHPDDASNKVLTAIARVLLAVNNCAMTIKDLAETCLFLGLLCHNVSAASQAITHWLRNHQKRCRDEGDKPLVLKHVLTGTRADDAVAPALHSLSGGAPDKGSADRASPGDGPRETHFRRGTVVWYLSAAAGAPCPFARAGITPPSPDSASFARKRKRPPSGHVPGPQPQRPKLVLRLKPLPRTHQSHQPGSDAQEESDSDDSASDAASNSSVMQIDTPFSPFPPASSISIPLYMPDPDSDARRRYADALYDSDAPLPPDSEDEDDDYHNSMMRPLDLDSTTSPATTAEPCTPAVKQELSPPVTIVKSEFDPDSVILFHGWGAPSLEAKQEESVIRILPFDWASPPDVIDLVQEPWRFPSVSTDASEDFDLDVFVKEEEVIAKLEPADEFPLSYRSSVSCEQEGDDDVWQPGAIPEDVVEEVSRRLALTSFSFSDLPSLDSVAAEDFDGAWCADQEPAASRGAAVRRATLPCLPSSAVRPACRPGRAASMSALPRRVVLRTCTPFCPAIMATFIDGIPVYQTFLDTHRLLRRMDSDFVNVATLMRFLQLRVDVTQEQRCVIVRDGRDGVPGVWAPLEFAQRLAHSQVPSQAGVVPRLPKDVLGVFLAEGLEAHFPSPLPEVRDGNMERFGDPFGEHGEALGVEDVCGDWAAVPALQELANLTLAPLAPLPTPELAETLSVAEVKGPVDLMAVLDPMHIDDAVTPQKPCVPPAAAAAPPPPTPPEIGPRRTLRKHSQLASLAIASIAERDQEDSSSSSEDDEDGEDEESDLTEPEPEDEKENAPVEPVPAKSPLKSKTRERPPRSKPLPPTTPTNATGPRTRRQTEEEAASKQTPRRTTRSASAGNNLGALALAVGASRKRGVAAKGK